MLCLIQVYENVYTVRYIFLSIIEYILSLIIVKIIYFVLFPHFLSSQLITPFDYTNSLKFSHEN